MTISIIVEDGSIVEDANSYIAIADCRSFASMRGVELSSNDDDVAAQLINANDYINSFAAKFKGVLVSPMLQNLPWPRCKNNHGVQTPLIINGKTVGINSIPKELVELQCQLVIAQFNGVVLQPNITPSDYVIRETIGPITTEYADPSKYSMSTVVSTSEFLLNSLLNNTIAYGFTTIRV